MSRLSSLLVLLVVGACTSNPEQHSGTQDIRSVCAPTATRNGASFQVRVQGGCDPNPDGYRCEVSKGSQRVDVRLIGPVCEGCQCATVDKACVVPALEEGLWTFQFAEGSELDREVDVAPGHPVFSCAADGGVADGG